MRAVRNNDVQDQMDEMGGSGAPLNAKQSNSRRNDNRVHVHTAGCSTPTSKLCSCYDVIITERC